MAFSPERYPVRIMDYLNESWQIMAQFPMELMGMGLMIVGAALIPIANWVLVPCLIGGYIWIVLNLRRDRTIRLEDMVRGFDWFLPLVLAGLILKFMTLFALVLCIVPGVVVVAFYIFTFVLIVDRNLDFWTAMETSRKKVMENFLEILGFVLVLLLILLAGFLCCGFGILFTFPFVLVMHVVAYRDIFRRA